MTPLCGVQKLLSSFKDLETVQGYDGSQTVASIPGHLPTQLCHILTAIFVPQSQLVEQSAQSFIPLETLMKTCKSDCSQRSATLCFVCC